MNRTRNSLEMNAAIENGSWSQCTVARPRGLSMNTQLIGNERSDRRRFMGSDACAKSERSSMNRKKRQLISNDLRVFASWVPMHARRRKRAFHEPLRLLFHPLLQR